MKFGRFMMLFVAALFLCGALPASAAPALWIVRGSAGTVYLFGTIHALRDNTQWKSPEMEAAIARSQDLYEEVADLTNVAGMAKSLSQLAYDPAHPLSSKIPKADVAKIDSIAKRYGFPGEVAFESMQPWFVFLRLSLLPVVHSGYASSNGVDVQIRQQFVTAGKPVLGLETADSQLHIFADLSQADQIALLESELAALAKSQRGVTRLDSMVNVWMTGDQEKFAATMRLDKDTTNPFYARLLTNRNKAWAALLAKRLQQPGKSFVSVGALHMLGPNGVPALLAAMGFSVTRVPTTDVVPSAAPSPAPNGSAEQLSVPVDSPSASPTPSATPIPQTIAPPSGWKPRKTSMVVGSFRSDKMWSAPDFSGAMVTGHIDIPPGAQGLDIDTFDTFFRQGLIAQAGSKGLSSAERVKICQGKQDGMRYKLVLHGLFEEIVVGFSDRAYLAEYVRRTEVPEDAAAVRSLLSLCAP
jgi:uncharacterized protein YbaP (TraB family)